VGDKKTPAQLATGVQVQAVFAGDGGEVLPGNDIHVGVGIGNFKPLAAAAR
jgi:hypothetical protein